MEIVSLCIFLPPFLPPSYRPSIYYFACLFLVLLFFFSYFFLTDLRVLYIGKKYYVCPLLYVLFSSLLLMSTFSCMSKSNNSGFKKMKVHFLLPLRAKGGHPRLLRDSTRLTGTPRSASHSSTTCIWPNKPHGPTELLVHQLSYLLSK